MNQKTVNAFILGRRDFFEADRLLSLYTKELGKIKILAKGARKLKSKMAGHLEPFTLGKYSIISGKNFYILTGAESEKNNLMDRENESKIDYLFYICELTDTLTEEGEADTRIYNLLLEFSNNIKSTKIPEILVRYFEINLLNFLGYMPNFKVCRKCNQPLLESDYYSGDFEGIKCNKCSNLRGNIDKNTLKIISEIDRQNFHKIEKIKEVEKYNNKLKNFTKTFIINILPRELKSKDI